MKIQPKSFYKNIPVAKFNDTPQPQINRELDDGKLGVGCMGAITLILGLSFVAIKSGCDIKSNQRYAPTLAILPMEEKTLKAEELPDQVPELSATQVSAGTTIELPKVADAPSKINLQTAANVDLTQENQKMETELLQREIVDKGYKTSTFSFLNRYFLSFNPQQIDLSSLVFSKEKFDNDLKFYNAQLSSANSAIQKEKIIPQKFRDFFTETEILSSDEIELLKELMPKISRNETPCLAKKIENTTLAVMFAKSDEATVFEIYEKDLDGKFLNDLKTKVTIKDDTITEITRYEAHGIQKTYSFENNNLKTVVKTPERTKIIYQTGENLNLLFKEAAWKNTEYNVENKIQNGQVVKLTTIKGFTKDNNKYIATYVDDKKVKTEITEYDTKKIIISGDGNLIEKRYTDSQGNLEKLTSYAKGFPIVETKYGERFIMTDIYENKINEEDPDFVVRAIQYSSYLDYQNQIASEIYDKELNTLTQTSYIDGRKTIIKHFDEIGKIKKIEVNCKDKNINKEYDTNGNLKKVECKNYSTDENLCVTFNDKNERIYESQYRDAERIKIQETIVVAPNGKIKEICYGESGLAVNFNRLLNGQRIRNIDFRAAFSPETEQLISLTNNNGEPINIDVYNSVCLQSVNKYGKQFSELISEPSVPPIYNCETEENVEAERRLNRIKQHHEKRSKAQ